MFDLNRANFFIRDAALNADLHMYEGNELCVTLGITPHPLRLILNITK